MYDDDELLHQFPKISETQGDISEADWRLIQEVSIELSRRGCESLNLYEPLPYQEKFHASTCKTVLIRGGNRSGKSLAGFVEDARALTGQDPHEKYPKKGGVMAIIGADLKHIGMVVFRYLFLPGAFYVIRDLETGKIRSFRPWDSSDRKREHERMPAPPLIPPRFCDVDKDVAYKDKRNREFTLASMSTDWELMAISSNAKPPQGYKAHLIHIDEDLNDESHYSEAKARLADYKGLLRVTAMPHNRNDFINTICDSAEKADEKGYSDTHKRRRFLVIPCTMDGNPHLDEEERQDLADEFMSQGREVYMQRVLGEIDTESTLVYPTFSKQANIIGFGGNRFPLWQHEIMNLIEVPRDWCRYTWTDPGHQHCATLFFAVPPPSYGDFLVIYDEIYIRQCNAETLAEAMKAKLHDQDIQEFGIDDHGSRPTETGSGLSIRAQYAKAFERHEVFSVGKGVGFVLGSDDVMGRVSMVRSALSLRNGGPPRLLFLNESCAPNTIGEFKRYRKKTVHTASGQTYIEDKPVARNNHGMNCIEYAVANGCKYVPPPVKGQGRKSFSQRVIEAASAEIQKLMNPYGPSDGSISLGSRGVPSK